MYIPKGDPLFKKEGEQIFAGFYLSTDISNFLAMFDIYTISGPEIMGYKINDENKTRQQFTEFFYKKVSYNNFFWGQVRTYVAIINENLHEATTRPRGAYGLFKVTDNEDLKNLKEATLYVPDYLLKSKKALGRFVTEVNTTEAVLMADYKYSYKMLPSSEISEIILGSDEPVYFLDFVCTSMNSFFVVYNSKSHKPVYAKLANGTVPSAKLFKELKAKIDAPVQQSGPPNPFRK